MTPDTRLKDDAKWRLALQIENLVKAEVGFWQPSAVRLREHWGFSEEHFEKVLQMRWPLTFACDAADVLDLPLRVSRAPVHAL